MSKYEYVYYTALIHNDGSETPAFESEVEPHLKFEEDRVVPLLEDSENYEMAVTSAKIDLKTLPVFIPTIKYNSGSPSDMERVETIYEITLEYNGYSATKPVYFKAQDQTISDTAPSFINGYANYKSNYYNYYNYESFFTKVNNAIISCFTELLSVATSYNKGTVPTAFSNLSSSSKYELPYFIFDKESSLVFMNAPKTTFDSTNSSDSYFSIYLNKALYRLFNSLPFLLQENTFLTLDDDSNQTSVTKTLFKLNLNNFKNANEVELYPHLSDFSTGSTKTTHFVIYQDYETLTSWSPVESIVFTSPNFPIDSNQVSAPMNFKNGVPTSQGTIRSETEILDFRTGQPVPGIIYEPSIHRWSHLKQSDSGFRRIIINVYYRFKNNGQLIPVKCGIGSSMSIKLVFRKLIK
jgi:hypothetical protein